MIQTKATQERVGEADLEAAVERFARWRQARQRGEHIPRELWSEAVDAAPDAVAQFVQMLVAPPEGDGGAARASASAPPCVLELRNARGATLRLELPLQAQAILPGLCAAFAGI